MTRSIISRAAAAVALIAALGVPSTGQAAAESACGGTALSTTCEFGYAGHLWTRGAGVDGVNVVIKDADGNELLGCAQVTAGTISTCRGQGSGPDGLQQGAALTCEATGNVVAFTCASGLTG